MDVRCDRCSTEYEFDDALVSDRGTTVECTNCGHKFKVYPLRRGSGAQERWVVRTGSGRELVYTSLRDLQAGIARGQIGPEDLLSRENYPTRPLGSIAELEPFLNPDRGFRAAAYSRPAATLAGVAPPPNLDARASARSATTPDKPVQRPHEPTGTPARGVSPQRVVVGTVRKGATQSLDTAPTSSPVTTHRGVAPPPAQIVQPPKPPPTASEGQQGAAPASGGSAPGQIQKAQEQLSAPGAPGGAAPDVKPIREAKPPREAVKPPREAKHSTQTRNPRQDQ
jgi:predicted Zn finger-like uncharacterized protein